MLWNQSLKQITRLKLSQWSWFMFFFQFILYLEQHPDPKTYPKCCTHHLSTSITSIICQIIPKKGHHITIVVAITWGSWFEHYKIRSTEVCHIIEMLYYQVSYYWGNDKQMLPSSKPNTQCTSNYDYFLQTAVCRIMCSCKTKNYNPKIHPLHVWLVWIMHVQLYTYNGFDNYDQLATNQAWWQCHKTKSFWYNTRFSSLSWSRQGAWHRLKLSREHSYTLTRHPHPMCSRDEYHSCWSQSMAGSRCSQILLQSK